MILPVQDADSGYRHQLRTVLSATAAPYGYTLALWTGGAMASRAANAFPTTVEALLLVGGAIAGFGLLAGAAFGGLGKGFVPTVRRQVKVWGGLHIPALGTSILTCAGLVEVLRGRVMWLAIGFAVTTTYLVVLSGQYWLTGRGSE